MKKHFFVFVIFLLAAGMAFGQIAVQAGYNSSRFLEKYTGDDPDEQVIVDDWNEMMVERPSFHIGAMTEVNLVDFLLFQAGLIFNEKGVKVILEDDANLYWAYKERLYQLDVPILLTGVIPIGEDWEIRPSAGGYGSLALFGHKIDEYEDQMRSERDVEKISWEEKNEEHFEFGVTFGASVKYQSFELGGAYDMGLSDFTKEESDWNTDYRLWKVFGRYWF